MTDDRATQWLKNKGFSDGDVKAGAEGRVRIWELASRELAEGWDMDEHGFREDLGARQLLHEMELAGLLDEHQLRRVHLADHQFKAATEPSQSPHSDAPGLEQSTHWWFWRNWIA